MATPRPAVHVVATGGSISGLGPHRLDYIPYPELGQRLSIEERWRVSRRPMTSPRSRPRISSGSVVPLLVLQEWLSSSPNGSTPCSAVPILSRA